MTSTEQAAITDLQRSLFSPCWKTLPQVSVAILGDDVADAGHFLLIQNIPLLYQVSHIETKSEVKFLSCSIW